MSNGGDIGGRAGAQALSLLGTAPNTVVLGVLAEGPSNVAGLQGPGGSPGSTLRARLKDLAGAGVIVTRHANGFPRGAAEYELTESGRELLVVAGILERWLAESPNGRRAAAGGNGTKATVGAMVEGWSATLLRALAAKPLSIADLDSVINGLNYPSLERRIAAMRHAGQVEACVVNGRETPYAVTPWLRRGVAPLLAAIRWERLHLPDGGVPVAGMDFEAAFLLAVPLLELEDGLTGSCRLAVEVPVNGKRDVAGVLVGVEEGGAVSCGSRLVGDADAWASGPVSAWLRALIDCDPESLELGGDGRLARTLVAGLHEALFAPVSHQPRDEAFA